MKDIQIAKAISANAIGGELSGMALDYMAYPLVGTTDCKVIEHTFMQLWKKKENRFSHQYSYVAQLNQKPVGMITCYPVPILERLALPTFRQLIFLRGWELIRHSIMNFQDLWALANLKEGREDEYHIGALATLPESRGYGVGSQLIQFAENIAKEQSFQKCSLTVKTENVRALKLYEKMGYQVVNEIERPPYSLYRMSKTLSDME